MLKIGILGCGQIAQQRHMPEYAANKNCELIGYYNPTHQKAEDMAARYGGAVYDSVEELLALSPDAVSVCLANAAHAPVSIAALEAGAHVLCEKPMAANLSEALAMTETAERTGKTLMIAYNQRFAKTNIKARELLRSGAIGRLLTFNTFLCHAGPENWLGGKQDTWFFNKDAAAFGAMADLGSHKTDLIRFLTGERIAETSAKVERLDKTLPDGSPIGVDDNAICIYTLESGAIGTLCASWTDYGRENDATVLYGTDGVLRIYDDPNHSLVLERKNGETEYFNIDARSADAITGGENSGVIDYFVDCILNKKTPHIDAAEALLTARVIEANAESAKTAKAVRIEY